MKTAVHGEDSASHLTGSVRSEVQSRLSDVLRLADMADGYALIHPGSLFRGDNIHHRRLSRARADAVDTDVLDGMV